MKFSSSRLARFALCLAPALAVLPALAPSASAQNALAKSASAKPTFTSKKYGFALYLPKTPQTKKQALPAQIGGGSTDIYFVLPQPVSYSIVPITLPAKADGMSQKQYFDTVQKGILLPSKGKLVGARDIKVNGVVARDFQWSFSAPTPESKTPIKFAGRTRIYKIGRRTLQFTALVKSAEFAKNQAHINKVLNSIVITK